jgi:hypothetical protein
MRKEKERKGKEKEKLISKRVIKCKVGKNKEEKATSGAKKTMCHERRKNFILGRGGG